MESPRVKITAAEFLFLCNREEKFTGANRNE
jgi:hypothetical protein